MIEDIRKKMREIPGMDILLAQDWALPWIGELGRETVKRVLNGELTRIRRRMLAGEDADISVDALKKNFEALLSREGLPRLRRVIPVLRLGGTGIDLSFLVLFVAIFVLQGLLDLLLSL